MGLARNGFTEDHISLVKEIKKYSNHLNFKVKNIYLYNF